jgi:acyl-CoA thioester hydrolase
VPDLPATLPTTGRFEGREHLLPIRVYYEDTDFTGRVYHASYVRFLERGRSDFLRLAGADHVAMAALDTAFAVITLAIAFKAAARIDDALLVRTTFDTAKGPRVIIRQRVMRDDVLIATAEVEVACIDAAGRARRPPPPLVAALTPYLA